jgi:hypothetical protein
MSDSSKKLPEGANSSEPPKKAVPPSPQTTGEPEANQEATPNGHAAGAGPNSLGWGDDPREALKQGIEKTRLPPDLRDEILADLPPPEERERLYRELIEQGGLSWEEFAASLGLEDQPKP